MSVQPSCEATVSPAHVWACLAKDLQERAIRLMAQLAFNQVAAQSSWFVKEPDHAHSAQPPQNSI
jgi:hypothetical protein